MLEWKLLSRIIDTHDIGPLLTYRITEDFFADPMSKAVFRLILNHYNDDSTLHLVPSYDTVYRKIRTFERAYTNCDEHVATLAEDLMKEYKTRKLLELASEMTEGVDDPDLALSKGADKIRQLTSVGNRANETDIGSSSKEIIEEYMRMKEGKGMLGIPYPWEILNQATSGMCRQHMIVLYGRTKSMKTWIATWIAVHAYLHGNGRILFMSYEMKPEEIRRRAVAIIARVPYDDFRLGKLSPEVEKETLALLEALEEMENLGFDGNKRRCFKIVHDPGGSITAVRQRIEEFQPDLVVADSIYKMYDARGKTKSFDWKNIANISADWKLTAQQYDIPVLVTTQANRSAEVTKGEGTSEMSFSDGPMMDADLIMRVIKEKREATGTNSPVKLTVKIPGIREGTLDSFAIRMLPAIYAEQMPVDEELEVPAKANHPPVKQPERCPAPAIEEGEAEEEYTDAPVRDDLPVVVEEATLRTPPKRSPAPPQFVVTDMAETKHDRPSAAGESNKRRMPATLEDKVQAQAKRAAKALAHRSTPNVRHN